VRGLVIDAGLRDVAELTAMGFPARSGTTSAQGTEKETPGYIRSPIVCAGVPVGSGDVTVADDDGAVGAARARDAGEATRRRPRTNGELSIDIYDMRRYLFEMGLHCQEADPHGRS
jgi:4-hydroxy-4-methyl-2-oxoglutarate aldolase